MKNIFIISAFSCLLYNVAACAEVPVKSIDIAKLLPQDSTILQSYPADNAQDIWNPGLLKLFARRSMKDCIVNADFDKDGENELIVIYSNKSAKGGMSLPLINIYKKLKGEWELKHNGLEHKMISVGDAHTGHMEISICDLDDDKVPEIMVSSVWDPLPAIYKWNRKSHTFSPLVKSEILNKLYKQVIDKMERYTANGGPYGPSDWWALFESYDKLGNSKNTLKAGKRILKEEENHDGTYWIWATERIQKRVNQLESK